jgi:hypothetical protein
VAPALQSPGKYQCKALPACFSFLEKWRGTFPYGNFKSVALLATSGVSKNNAGRMAFITLHMK